MEINIYYEDTDCGGVVYYANYLKYFERVRTEFLAKRGISLSGYMKKGVLFTVVSADLKYRSPAHYGDTLILGMNVEKVRGSSFVISYTIKRKSTLLVTGATKMACVDENMKPAPLPDDIRAALEDGKEGG